MSEFNCLLHQKIERLFLILWPPHFEESWQDVDISLGLVLSQSTDCLYVITTGEDAWTPCLRKEALPCRIFPESEFERRAKSWMAGNELGYFEYEYYDFSESEFFTAMVSHAIRGVELLAVDGDKEYFGVRLVFSGDYILSLPMSDGNTIETSRFNQTNQLEVFKKLGMVTIERVGSS